MAIKGIDFNFTGPTVSIANYDQTKTNLGTLIKQYTGAGNEDKFAGPIKGAILRPTETSFSQYQPYGLKYRLDFHTRPSGSSSYKKNSFIPI